ncbi:MAG: glycosyltransferase family 39 protein [Chloroflexota bacterium]|nr:glycosyltransferase family 39 protein [Chloroflexota bacterium]
MTNPIAPPLVASASPGADPAAWRRADLRNLAILAAGFCAVLLLLPPAHEWAVLDDWIYANAVQHQLATGAFAMPDRAQANLVGLVLWATAWARVLGFSYTTLTLSVLALTLPGLLAGYGLLRRLGVAPAGALFGTALLGLNPLFLHLAYSFMTDIPFVALLLISAYAYVRGLQDGRAGWLIVGGLFSGWAFLVRQFGVLLPFAIAGYLLLDSLLTRRLRWREAVAVLAVPVGIFAEWWLWSRGIPPSGAAVEAGGRRDVFFLKDPWLTVIALRTLDALAITGVAVPVAFVFRRRRLWLLPVVAAAMIAGLLWAKTITVPRIGIDIPPAPLTLGPWTVELPPQVFTFGGYGNLLRVEGIAFFEYRHQPIWNTTAWTVLYVLALILAVILVAKMADAGLDWLRDRVRRVPLSPAVALYAVGLGIFVIYMAATGDYFDRYLVSFLPFVVLFVARSTAEWGRRAWAVSLAGLALLGSFSLLLHADFADHDTARWQAGDWMLARVQPVQVGYDWGGVHGNGNGVYEVSDVLLDGFRIERTFPYTSRLSGFAPRQVFALARNDAPPLAK